MGVMGMFSQGAAKSGCVAVSVGANSIDVVRVERKGARPSVCALDSYARGGDSGQALRQLQRAGKIGGGICVALLASGEYQLVQLEDPGVDPAERNAALRWKLKDVVDFPVDDATIDSAAIPMDRAPSGRQKQVYVAVANNLVLGPKVRLFQEAKVMLSAIDIPEFALRNVARLFETENRGLAMLNFDRDGSSLVCTFGGDLFMFRHNDVTLDQLEQADETRRADLFDRLALEAQRSIDNFERLYNFISFSRLIVTDLPTVPGLLDHLRGYLSLPVEPLDLAAVIDFETIPELRDSHRQAECLELIGAALRETA